MQISSQYRGLEGKHGCALKPARQKDVSPPPRSLRPVLAAGAPGPWLTACRRPRLRRVRRHMDSLFPVPASPPPTGTPSSLQVPGRGPWSRMTSVELNTSAQTLSPQKGPFQGPGWMQVWGPMQPSAPSTRPLSITLLSVAYLCQKLFLLSLPPRGTCVPVTYAPRLGVRSIAGAQ